MSVNTITNQSSAILSDASDLYPNVQKVLKDIPNWVNWILERKANGKGFTKVPYVAGSRRKASCANPKCYRSFAEAVASDSSHIGFCFKPELKLVSLDLDGCRNPETGEITPWAQKLIKLCNSYTEVTPSKTGVRIWFRGTMPPGSRDRFYLNLAAGYGDKVEIQIFSVKGYVTVTGDVVNSTDPLGIDDQISMKLEEQDTEKIYQAVLEIAAQHPRSKEEKSPSNSTSEASTPGRKGSSIWTTKNPSVKGSKLQTLLHGKIMKQGPPIQIEDDILRVEYPSQSEADYALIGMLIDKHGDNADAGWSEFVASPLYRGKKYKRNGLFKNEWTKLRDNRSKADAQTAFSQSGGSPPPSDADAPHQAETPARRQTTSNVLPNSKLSSDEIVKSVQTNIAIPPFPNEVIRGFYASVVDSICNGTTLPRQFAYQVTKTILGIIASGRISFNEMTLLPHYYLMLIALTGTGKGEVYRRDRLILLDHMRKYLQISDSADSGAGLKDAFFTRDENDESLPHNVLLFVDELLDLMHKSRPDKQPEIVSTIGTLANEIVIGRTKAIGRDRKKAIQTCHDARLAFISCIQPDLVSACFVGVRSGSMGWWDRFYPEYAEKPVAEKMPPIPAEVITSIREQMHNLPFDDTMRFSDDATEYFETFWNGLTEDERKETRARTRVQLDCYMQALGQFRTEVCVQDVQDAVALHRRQQVIRRAYFGEELPDKVGHYIYKLKCVMNRMLERLRCGVPPEDVALTERELAMAVDAYRDNEGHIFDRAWVSFKK